MSSVSIRVSGMEAILENIHITQTNLVRRIDSAIQGAGIRCQALAKQYCPVDTGRLRSSIQYTSGYLTCTVGTDVQYAIYIEYGTWKMRAQPFLNPAYQQALMELIDELNGIQNTSWDA